MKDFSNYKKHVEIDMKSYSGNFHFNEQLKQEGSYIRINNESTQSINGIETEIKAIVRNHGNEYNESKEERSIMIDKKYAFKSGDYVEYLGDIYLTNNSIDKDNPFFNTAKMTRCNYILNWMCNEALYQTPCIITNQTKYTLGISTPSNTITEGDSRYEITMPYSEETKNIRTGQRFIFNSNAWKVTQVDYVSSKGLMSILLGQTAINYEVDNLDLEIANYKAINHTYTYDIPTSFEVSKDSDYNLVYSIKDETGKDVDYNLVTVSTTDTSLVQLTNTNGVITIKGLSAGIGSIKLVATLSSETKEFDIAFEVKETVVNQINYTTKWSSTGTTLKTYVASTAQCTKYINGVEQDGLVISYEIDSVGQSLVNTSKIAITQPSSSSVQIRNKSVSSTTTFTIIIKDSSDGIVITNQVITLTGM